MGHIEHRIPVKAPLVTNLQAVFLQRIGHRHPSPAGEALIPVGGFQGQGDGAGRVPVDLPHPVKPVVRAAVQIVGTLVGGEGNLLPA